jgi:hypothetical protein
MITVSHTEGPDPDGVDPLAVDELRVGFNNKPGTVPRMPRRPWSDRSRDGVVGSEETIMLESNLPSDRVAILWNKGRLIGPLMVVRLQNPAVSTITGVSSQRRW